MAIQSGMNDYAQILYNKRRLIPQNINNEFERNLAFVEKAVADSDAEKIVVVTHHLQHSQLSKINIKAVS